MLKVAFPEQWLVEDTLLLFLPRTDWIAPVEVYDALADLLDLTPDQRRVRRADREELEWHNRVQWARQGLVNKGWLDASRPGFWRLTPAGAEVARYRQEVRKNPITLESLGL